jgi:hypothetical protein
METKTFEIRDSCTFIPALATRLIPNCAKDRYLLARAGYGRTEDRQGDFIILMDLENTTRCNFDIYGWPSSRTFHIAHKYIKDNWHRLTSGEVIDVEYIIGETKQIKTSEQETCPE